MILISEIFELYRDSFSLNSGESWRPDALNITVMEKKTISLNIMAVFKRRRRRPREHLLDDQTKHTIQIMLSRQRTVKYVGMGQD